MKKFVYIMILLAASVLAAGCGKGDNVKTTTLYVEKDGTVVQAITEAMDKSYFNEKDLDQWVEDYVKEYNKEAKKEAIQVKKSEVEEKKAKVTIEYASMEDYSAFNNVEAFEGTVAKAQKEGYDLNREFKSAKGKPSITMDEIDGSEEYHIIVLEESQTVVLEKDALYASSNVKCNGKKAAAKIKTGEFAYIIYKP